MYLSRLTVDSFRNLAPTTLEFTSRVNLFHGENGQGKTNLLESIYILSNLKSFRTSRTRDLIRHGSDSAYISGSIVHGEYQDDLSLSMDHTAKRPAVNGNHPDQITGYLALMPTVLFAPGDIDIIRGEPELRRRFLDRSIFSTTPLYLRELQHYSKALSQRNHLLRSGDTRSLETWDHELVRWGSIVTRRRISQTETLGDEIRRQYRLLSGKDHEMSIRYRSTIADGTDPTEDDLAACFMAGLKARRVDETLRRTTQIGPHRDDLVIMINGNDARSFGSQGEQRTAALTLRLAELVVVEQSRGYPPILLLDDLASELDERRLDQIMNYLSERRTQMFISATGRETIMSRCRGETRLFRVFHGTVTPEADRTEWI